MNKNTYFITGLCVVGVIFSVAIKKIFFKTSSIPPEDRDNYQAPIYRGPVDPPGTTFGGKNKKQKTKNKKIKKVNNKSKRK